MLKFLLAITSSSFKKKKEITKFNGIDIFLLRVTAYKGVSYTWSPVIEFPHIPISYFSCYLSQCLCYTRPQLPTRKCHQNLGHRKKCNSFVQYFHRL